MLIGLLGIAFGIAFGWYVTRRASTTRWAPLALPVLLLVAVGVAVLADGDVARAAAGVGAGIAVAMLVDAVVRSLGAKPHADDRQP